jgi:hypothetical protein
MMADGKVITIWEKTLYGEETCCLRHGMRMAKDPTQRFICEDTEVKAFLKFHEWFVF